MAKIDFCMMQTVGEDGVNTRPMSNNGEVQYDGDNWFFSRADSTKNGEIEKDDRVQLTFTDPEEMNFISVWGKGEIVDDVDKKKELWQDELKAMVQGRAGGRGSHANKGLGPQDPNLGQDRRPRTAYVRVEFLRLKDPRTAGH